MAIKFSQFNLRTNSTPTMFLVGYDGNQNIHITVDNLFNDFINGTENTIAMFGTGGTILADSILLQDAGATILTVAGQLNVDAAATFDTSITVTGNSTLNGNVQLGNGSADLITQYGTLYLNGPVKDKDNNFGGADQILVSNISSELRFTDLDDTTVGKAEAVVQTIKCNEAIPKGCPVYIVGFQPGENANIVAKADASNPAKMPATGVADDDYAAQDFGTMTAFGSFNGNFDTTGGTENWSIGDILYVKPGGGLTNIKPTGTNLIQNIAIVSRVQSQTGEIEVIALGRTNDIPNLTPGKIWVGSTGNTIESSSITFTEATGAVQLNQYGSGTITGTAARNLSVDSSGNIIETSTSASGSGTTDTLPIWSDGPNGVLSDSIITQTSSPNKITIGGELSLQGSGDILNISHYLGSTWFIDTSTGDDILFGAPTTNTQNVGVQGDLYAYGGDLGTKNLGVFNNLISRTGDSYFNVGNVGIGTTNPSEKLEVEGSVNNDDVAIRIENTYDDNLSSSRPAAALTFETASNNGYLRVYGAPADTAENHQIDLGSTAGSSYLTFSPNGSEKMRITSTGNVGIGTDNPQQALDVRSAISVGNSFQGDIYFSSVSNGPRITGIQPALGGQLVISTSGSEKMRISSTGNVGIGNLNPSYLLDVNEDDDVVAFRVTGGGGGAAMASFVRDVGATGASVNINAQSNFPQIQFVSTGNTFSIGADSNGNFKISDNTSIGTNDRITIDNIGDVGIGTTGPQAKLDVNGGVRIANDAAAASATNVGTLRYRTSGNNSYVDMVMQTGASTYAWVNIVENNW